MPKDEPQDKKPSESTANLDSKLAALGFKPEQDKTDDGLPGIAMIGGVRRPDEPSEKP